MTYTITIVKVEGFLKHSEKTIEIEAISDLAAKRKATKLFDKPYNSISSVTLSKDGVAFATRRQNLGTGCRPERMGLYRWEKIEQEEKEMVYEATIIERLGDMRASEKTVEIEAVNDLQAKRQATKLFTQQSDIARVTLSRYGIPLATRRYDMAAWEHV